MWQTTYFYPPHSEFKWLWFLACFFFLMLEGFQGPQTGKQLTWTVFNKENKRIPRNGRSWSIVWHVFLLFVFCSLIFGNKLCRNLNRSLSSYQNSYLAPRLRRIKKRRRILYPWILIRFLMFYTPQPRIHEWILRIRNLLYHSILSTVSKGTKIRHGSTRQWKGHNGAIKTWRGSKNNMVLVAIFLWRSCFMVAEIEEPKEEKKSCVGLKKIHSHPTQ